MHDQEKTRPSDEPTQANRSPIPLASAKFIEDVMIRRLLGAIAEGVIIIDATGTIQFVNTIAEKMFGYEPKDLIGKPHAMLIPERFRKIHEDHEAGYLKEPKIRPMGQLLDLYGLRRDGSEFPLEISLSYMETDNGLLVFAFISDITLRREYERRLRESEELFRLQVENIKDYAIYSLDPRGNVLTWNAGAEHLKGYRSEDIIGKNFSCFYPEEERNAGRPEQLLRIAAEEERVEAQEWRVRKDGSRFWAEVAISALRFEDGSLLGYSNVTRDITERRRAEEELKDANAELARSNRDLEMFASVASHDLQEPLKTITSYAELFAHKYQGKLDQQADNYIHFIVDGTEHMRILINDLLAYSRIGTRGKPLAPVQMNTVLDRALQSLARSLGDSGSVVDLGDLPEVEGDSVQMQELFQNLIVNAVKFRKKDVRLRIRVSAERKENEWVFGVHDNGIGIESRFVEQIFEVFRRLHTRRQYEGSGMGLAICRKIVERHGGHIWVESSPGEGSSFFFTLPAKGAPHDT